MRTGWIAMFLIAAPFAQAWNGTGHMTVAYVAYQNLTPQTRAHVDQLLTLNPMYSTWTAKTPTAQKGLVAFLSAATWPDCIKEAAKCPGYHEDGADTGDTPPPDPTASQNIGYSDKAMHKYSILQRRMRTRHPLAPMTTRRCRFRRNPTPCTVPKRRRPLKLESCLPVIVSRTC